jgi:hypothetical protein
MANRDWLRGDNVIHAARPEWGSGEVLVAEPVVHEGKPCQRLTIRFSRAGTKTVSTAFAALRPASEQPRLPDPAPEPEAGPGGPPSFSDAARTPAQPAGDDPISKAAQAATVAETLTRLPEAAVDPFSSLRSRLSATLALYKFTATGGSLLDWAAIQTGLKDPLSRFSRHELEQWFQRYQFELDAHLKRLLRDVRKQEPGLVGELTASAPPGARAALRRADMGR